MGKKFVSWRRLSTLKQGASGLGLAAQTDIEGNILQITKNRYMKLIKLTRKEWKGNFVFSDIYINAEYLSSVATNTATGDTEISMSNGDKFYVVEKAEEVRTKINE